MCLIHRNVLKVYQMVKCEKMYRTTDCILKHAQIYQNVVKRNKVHEMYRTE